MKRSLWFYSGITLLVLVTAGWLVLRYVAPIELPIQNVKITGDLPHVTQARLEQVIMPFVQSDFFELSVNELCHNLLELPWIKAARVARVWPSGVKVTLQEQQALARWNKRGLMNEHGELFFPDIKTFPADLPQLVGPTERAKLIFTQYKAIKRLLKPLNLKLTRLQLTERGAWTLNLNNGMQLLLGTREPIKRLNQFINVYNGVFASPSLQARQVDLRYSNGMAVKWRKAPG